MRKKHVDKIREVLSSSWTPFEGEEFEIEIQQMVSLCEEIQMDYDLCHKRWKGKYLKWMRFYKEYPENCFISSTSFKRKTFDEIKWVVSDIVRPSSKSELIKLVKEGYHFHLNYDDWKKVEVFGHFVKMIPSFHTNQVRLVQPNPDPFSVDKFTFNIDINDLKGDTK